MNESDVKILLRLLKSSDPLSELTSLFEIGTEDYSRFKEYIPLSEVQNPKNLSGIYHSYLQMWSERLPKSSREESVSLLSKQVQDVNSLLSRCTNEIGLSRPKYGLIVGRIQSGKTSHIGGLIASIFDEHEKTITPDLIVVLSGLAEDLRKQTSSRMATAFGDGNVFPGLDSDLSKSIGAYVLDDYSHQSIRDFLTSSQKIMVIKKNCDVLQELIDELPPHINQSLLIIDDESDHASIDNNRKSKSNDYDKNTDPSLTNKLLRTLISRFSNNHVWYLGYTASPFANLLIQPYISSKLDKLGLSLFPRDLIYALAPPSSYTGMEEYFLNHSLIKNIEVTDEISINQLSEFVLRHILSFKLRSLREGEEPPIHTSMIHTSMETKEHETIAYKIATEVLEDTLSEHSEFADVRRKLIQILQDYSQAPEFSEMEHWLSGLQWEEYIQFLDGISVVELNRRKRDSIDKETNIAIELDFTQDRCNYIVVGGSRLSRGLTVQYLCNSLFTRTAQVPKYDTMMQMARWCGYRGDYLDLTRIITTNVIVEHFEKIISVEADVREKIYTDFIENVKPLETIHWIRKHDGMEICRPEAIIDPMVRLTGGIRQEHIWSYDVPYSTPTSKPNTSRDRVFESFINLLKNIGFQKYSVPKTNSFSILKNVDSKLVMEFLKSFVNEYDEKDRRFTPANLRLLIEVIQHKKWDIGLNLPQKSYNTKMVYGDITIRLAQRAMEDDRFSIINSGGEHKFAGENPMLMLYTINPDSINTDGERNFDTINESPAILFGVFLSTDDIDDAAGIEYGAGRDSHDR